MITEEISRTMSPGAGSATPDASRPLHVVFVVDPGYGLETYARALARDLCALGQRATVLYVCLPGRNPGGPASDGPVRLEYVTVSNAHWYYDRCVKLLPRFVRTMLPTSIPVRKAEASLTMYRALRKIERESGGIDLIEGAEGFALPLFLRRWPYVIRLHGSEVDFRHWCHEEIRPDDRQNIRLQARLMREARLVTAPSEHMADHAASFYRYPRARIAVVPNALDVETFAPDERDEHRESVLFVGRLERRKGAHTVAAAATRILTAAPEIDLEFAGREGNVPPSDILAHIPAELHRRVRFHGPIPHDDLPALYRRAAVFVAPSQWETFCYTVAEAMACGTAVVGSTAGSIPELISDGETGVLIPIDDPDALAGAVIDLLRNAPRRARLGAAACQRAAAEFSSGRVAARTVDLYRAALIAARPRYRLNM